jgi:hypothetical protein
MVLAFVMFRYRPKPPAIYTFVMESQSSPTFPRINAHAAKIAAFVRIRFSISSSVITRSFPSLLLHKYWGLRHYVWDNAGDRATLRRADGSIVDRCRYAGPGSVATC